MATTIVTKNSSTAAAVPTAAQLVQGELAVNVADKRLFTEDNGGSIVELGTNPSSLTVSGNIDVDGTTNLDVVDIDGAVDMASTLTVTGEITANGGIALGDNDKATFGAGDDLEIYHDGSNSVIKDVGAGDLNISAGNDLRLQDSSGNNYFKAGEGGASKIYYAGAEKLATTSTGIDVTGSVVADGLSVSDSQAGGVTAQIQNSNSTQTGGSRLDFLYSGSTVTGRIQNRFNGADFQTDWFTGNHGLEIFTDSAKTEKRLDIAANGDISFYEDTGTTAKLFWDASAESLGIGTSSPASKLHVQGTGTTAIQITGGDSNVAGIYLGDAGGLANGRLSYSNSDNSLQLFTSNAERMRIDSSGNVGIGTSSPNNTTQIKTPINGGGLTLQRDSVTEGDYSQLSFVPSTADNAAPRGWIRGHRGSASTNTYLTFGTDNTERMRIDSSGNVGIGTSSPSGKTHSVAADAQVAVMAGGDVSDPQYPAFGFDGQIGSNGGRGAGMYRPADNTLAWSTAGTERARIDGGGSLLIGQTVGNVYNQTSVTGLKLDGPNGNLQIARSNNPTLLLNRYGNDGDLALFFKNGLGVGSIGTVDGFPYISSNSNVGLKFLSSRIRPVNSDGSDRDGAIDLGATSARFEDIYATNGTIQTSDRNEKQDIEALSDAEQRVAVACKGLLRKFRWKDSVAEKGDDARIHFGIIAQDLQAAFAAEGLDASDYAMFISTTWTDEETNEEKTRMGVRYSELLAFIIAAL